MPLTARQEELAARHLLAHPEEIALYLKQKRWEELVALVSYAEKDAPESLTHTDPALYEMLRKQITQYRLLGWDCLKLDVLKHLSSQ